MDLCWRRVVVEENACAGRGLGMLVTGRGKVCVSKR